MDDDSCPICMDTYTAKTRQKIKCQYCPTTACKGCQQRALLNTYEDPHCFSCKAGWSADFLSQHFPLAFRNQTLRHHRRKILLEREKAMLPAMQIFVEAKKNMEKYNKLFQTAAIIVAGCSKRMWEIRYKIQHILPEYNRIRLIRHSIKDGNANVVLSEEDAKKYPELKKAVKSVRDEEKLYYDNEYKPAARRRDEASREASHWYRVYQTGEDTGNPETVRREFLMRCPAEDCRGFLSTAYKCGVCEKKTCSDCLELLPAAEDAAAHTCNPQSVESAKAIKKETRPCPKCGSRIFKIDGCDQMWCTVEGCGTAFSWTSGHVVTGRVHNPHYYEWLRRNGGQAAPDREVGDIPCGGIPANWVFTRLIIQERNLTIDEKNKILEIHRNIVEFEARLNDYPARPAANANKDINVSYLTNVINEAEWQRGLEHAEARFNRKKEIGQILQTLITASAEILQGIVGKLENRPYNNPDEFTVENIRWIREVALPMFDSLRKYTNEAYLGLAKAQHMAVPQISDDWKWMGIRALYRKKGLSGSEPAEAAKGADADGEADLDADAAQAQAQAQAEAA